MTPCDTSVSLPAHAPAVSPRPLWRRLAALLDPPGLSYALTTWWFLRALGAIYTVAFLALVLQVGPLLGRGGLLPARLYLERVAAGTSVPWLQVPTLLWLNSSDATMTVLAWLGLGLAVLLLAGHASAAHLLALWALYASFVNVGQVFFGYGWEVLLLEAGFLAVFLAPLWRGGWRAAAGDGRAVLWLLRWLLVRVMLGAGLIKLRGDACWLDLSCLCYHFETQPLPNPLSPWFHALPDIVLRAGVIVNHLVELVVPLWLLAPPPARRVAAGLTALFLAGLIISGNFAWFNWLALALCLTCFDDRTLRGLVPRQWRGLAPRVLRGTIARVLTPPESAAPSPWRRRATRGLVVVVLLLSIVPVANMLSPTQVMNASFDPLRLVNTYGAFGHIGRERREVVLLGTLDASPTADADWREYAFPCKPGDPLRRPCIVSPYHLRLDWQMWFAAMSDYRTQPWLVHLVYKLLHGDADALSLLGEDPFDGRPPRWIRADLYRYRFAGREAGAAYASRSDGAAEPQPWWERERLGAYLPPLSASDPGLLRVISSFGWPLLSPTRSDADAATPGRW